ncbi:hypothetical protein GCM10027594_19220 [Hymenobacter agri]
MGESMERRARSTPVRVWVWAKAAGAASASTATKAARFTICMKKKGEEVGNKGMINRVEEEAGG